MNTHGEAKSSMTVTMIASQGARESTMDTVCCLLQYPLQSLSLVLAPQVLDGHTARIKNYFSQLPLQVTWSRLDSDHWDLSGNTMWDLKSFR